MMFSEMGEKAFTEDEFENWKKALEKNKSHEGSHIQQKLNSSGWQVENVQLKVKSVVRLLNNSHWEEKVFWLN